MKNFRKISREILKEIKGGEPVFTGIYTCCKPADENGVQECSTVVVVIGYDDLYCQNGTSLEKVL
ncbi:bacteriocin-like protein [Elizabethkingia meningoseptica]|uniref:bacteriocin-like protein n=1 Tax=Elizabethkingia meningoseptica TaxID=238 RepID=UPI00389182A9